MNARKYLLGIIIAIIVLLLIFSSKYLDWQWFKSMNAGKVFWITLITGPLTKLVIGIIILAFLMINLLFALKAFNRMRTADHLWVEVTKEHLILPGLIGTAILAFFLASGLSLDWSFIQQYLHRVSTGIKDPIFKQDLGFYLFSYPFYLRLNFQMQATFFLSILGSALIYFLAKAFWREGRRYEIWQPAEIHLTLLLILFLISKIWGYTLSRFGLLYRESARLTGVSYATDHANLLGITILIWVVVGLIILLLINLFRKSNMLILGGLGVWIALSIILGGVYPGLIQSFVVNPNEYELEKPYIQNHIQFTRKAYNLDQIKTKTFVPDENQRTPINMDNPSLADLRLWNYDSLKSSYNQLQSIRPYYEFNDIDIDRYPSVTGQRQVMLSAREFYSNKLPERAKTWINLHLVYTHGYGFAANQVSRFSDQGQPIFITRDLPPKTSSEFLSLKVKRPEIYFGESTDRYIIVNTKTEEFNYPQGEQNVGTTYQGIKGVPLNSFLNKLLFAVKYQESNFLLSNRLTPDSSIIMYRNINERVSKLAPFLRLDEDPYLVVANEKLYWIIDAYTVSSFYPYAKLHPRGINYIRNSVKVVINSYDGSVNFYVVDTQDPIIKVWQRVFPELFKPASEIAPDIASHFRYPETLITIQSDLLAQYHMTDPKTFYLQEDYWDIPIHNNNTRFEPYYITLSLPGVQKSEFVMMQPFSPRNKQNLSSWLIARCDQPNYGELHLYKMPKDINIYGPAQIDSRINQNETISQLITLWNQNESKVVWGNLLIIPIEKSILYVKPLFIESKQSQQAELKKIVMVYQNEVLIGDTVVEALSRITFDNPNVPDQPNQPNQTEPAKENSQSKRRAEIIQQIEKYMNEIQKLTKELKEL